MSTVWRSDPFREALTLHDAMNQLFAQSFVQPGWKPGNSRAMAAPVDVFENEHGYQVRVLLPGMKAEEIELVAQENTLTVKGQFHPWAGQDKQVNWLVQEIGSGPFERTITFPKPIDSEKIETSYENGILSLTVPIHHMSRPKRITITGGQTQPVMVEAGKS